MACFEICDHAGADKSPFLVRSKVARFNGYKGDRPVIVSAIYNACNVDWPCADLWAGVFKEIE